MNWLKMTPRQRLAAIDLMQATVNAELRPVIAEINAELDASGVPARFEIEVRLVIDPNRDPRLEK
jgi:hypothetical protein